MYVIVLMTLLLTITMKLIVSSPGRGLVLIYAGGSLCICRALVDSVGLQYKPIADIKSLIQSNCKQGERYTVNLLYK